MKTDQQSKKEIGHEKGRAAEAGSVLRDPACGPAAGDAGARELKGIRGNERYGQCRTRLMCALILSVAAEVFVAPGTTGTAAIPPRARERRHTRDRMHS